MYTYIYIYIYVRMCMCIYIYTEYTLALRAKVYTILDTWTLRLTTPRGRSDHYHLGSQCRKKLLDPNVGGIIHIRKPNKGPRFLNQVPTLAPTFVCPVLNGGMDPYSSPYIIPMSSPHNPFPTKHQGVVSRKPPRPTYMGIFIVLLEILGFRI